jgi:tetratricopeptide (TPR) repeat protein
VSETETAREAFNAALKQSDGTALARAATQVRLAELEMSAGHADAAQSLIAHALDVLNDPTHDSDPTLGLALDLAMQGAIGGVEAFARRRIDQLERQGCVESPEAIEPLNVIVRARLEAGRDEEATVLLERAERIAHRHRVSSRSVATCLGTLGELRRRTKQLPDAERLLMKAIGMMEAARGGDTLEMSRFLQSLGAAQRDLGRKAEAVQHLERALRIQQSQSQSFAADPSKAELLDVLGDVYLSLRRFQEAEAATQRAFDILQEKALIDTPERCRVAAHLGVILMEMNRPGGSRALPPPGKFRRFETPCCGRSGV